MNSLLFDYKEIKLEINNRKKTGKSSNTQTPNNTLLDNLRAKKQSEEKLKIH